LSAKEAPKSWMAGPDNILVYAGTSVATYELYSSTHWRDAVSSDVA
jgi:hypothetical protein